VSDPAAVRRLLSEAGTAHHDAFAATDGDDPEWPLWYAEHLHRPLAEALGSAFTRSELVAALVRAEREHRGSAEVAWEDFYAGVLRGELGSSSAPD
jgi:hypothetical protein